MNALFIAREAGTHYESHTHTQDSQQFFSKFKFNSNKSLDNDRATEQKPHLHRTRNNKPIIPLVRQSKRPLTTFTPFRSRDERI